MSTNDAKTTDANYRDLAECERAYGPIPERIRLVMASLPEADLAGILHYIDRVYSRGVKEGRR